MHIKKSIVIEKDLTWLSIENKLLNLYSKDEIISKINTLINQLEQKEATIQYQNFNCIYHQLYFFWQYSDVLDEYIDEYDNDESFYELHSELCCLINILITQDKQATIILLKQTYQHGLSLWIAWTSLLYLMTDCECFSNSDVIKEILLALEIENFFGIEPLKEISQSFWG